MEGNRKLYPAIFGEESQPLEAQDSHLSFGREHDQMSHIEEQSADGPSTGTGNFPSQEMSLARQSNSNSSADVVENDRQMDASNQKLGRYFYYDSPLHEETGIRVPVSVPPMSESSHEEWSRGLGSNGGFFPEGDIGWGQFVEDKELTMWDVVIETLHAARGKVTSRASGSFIDVECHGCQPRFLSKLGKRWHNLTQ